ncbi:MAG: glycosyl hydrolase [Isosphaeraceae bacterium]
MRRLRFHLRALAMAATFVVAGAFLALADDLEQTFTHPPDSARPGVLWMWMGCNLSKSGITRDLEALKDAGFGRTTMFSLADVTTPWAGEIGNSPTPEIISWTEPWWKLVRHAAEESRRLGMDFGMFNGPSYESSGGPWVTPELSMQQVCFSRTTGDGPGRVHLTLARPQVDPRAVMPFPVFNPRTGLVEKPAIPARKTFYRDIVVLALPAEGVAKRDQIIDLSAQMAADGKLDCTLPAGQWTIYRFGHTTMGTLIQPAQWKATGLECDKMNPDAVTFHMNHVIGEIQKHLGDLIGTGFTHVHFDSYEAGTPSWTPRMREEFAGRRGYGLTPFLATFAGRTVGSAEETARFRKDFEATIKDLYRDVYFATIRRMLHKAKLEFLCEPYGGPWRQDEIMPMVDRVMTEFWTGGGRYSPYAVDSTIAALRKSGQNIVEAEAFTGSPGDSQWTETPAWLKPIGDAAFCAGINRFVLHRFPQQPWDDRYRPGATMGQWGTHFDRTQTWWQPGKALFAYWHRCQALLQWGRIAPAEDFAAEAVQGAIAPRSIHRKDQQADVFFVANVERQGGSARCVFKVTGKQPELWDPVTETIRNLPEFRDANGKTVVTLPFAPAQSWFVVFRRQPTGARGRNFPVRKPVAEIAAPWKVHFDPRWGGPAQATFTKLEDWTKRPEPGIRYYSGTASYRTVFDGSTGSWLDLGVVNHLARVRINDRDLGVVWCAPWGMEIPGGLLRAQGNTLEIDVTNVWANRLIGDEQEPPDCQWLPGHMGGSFLKQFPDWFVQGKPRPSRGRYCFTTWNYFNRNSPLVPSGLLGPVHLMLKE